MITQYKVYFPAKECAVCAAGELDERLEGTQVLVKTEYDIISAGTELANYHALPNTVAAHGFPCTVGYSASARVLAVGPEVKDLKPGDKVVVRWGGHCSVIKTDRSRLTPIPDGIDMKEAAFGLLATFPLLAVRRLEVRPGECVMIAGCGLLGLVAVQYARLSGACPVLACDFSPERRELARQLGADEVFDPRDKDFIEKVKAASDGAGPAAVVEVTGYISALQQALEYIAWEGRIALLGCTRISDSCIDYYRYVHTRGIRLIGCHTNARPKLESQGDAWTEGDDCRTFLKFLQKRSFRVLPLVHSIVSPHDAESVYAELGKSKNPPLGVLFDWTGIS